MQRRELHGDVSPAAGQMNEGVCVEHQNDGEFSSANGLADVQLMVDERHRMAVSPVELLQIAIPVSEP